MANRKNYTVVVPFPTGGGHWARKGATVDLLDVQALALQQAGRIVLTADIEAAAAAAGAVLVEPAPVEAPAEEAPAAEVQEPAAAEPVAAKTTTKKTTAKD